MHARRSVISVLLAGAACGVAAACGAGGSESVAGTNSGSAIDVSPDSVGPGGRSELIPDTVTVTQPALVDTSARAADLPVWPGPDPTEFLAPNPPAGEIGQLTGAQAREVLIAAQNNPSEFWNVGGIVVWLVVT